MAGSTGWYLLRDGRTPFYGPIPDGATLCAPGGGPLADSGPVPGSGTGELVAPSRSARKAVWVEFAKQLPQIDADDIDDLPKAGIIALVQGALDQLIQSGDRGSDVADSLVDESGTDESQAGDGDGHGD